MSERDPAPQAPLRAAPGRSERAGSDPAGKRALFGSAPPAKPTTPDDDVDRAEVRVIEIGHGDAAAVVPLVDAPEGPVASPTERPGDVDDWGRSERMRALARSLYKPIYERWLRAEWEGLENIPDRGGALLVSNHAGAIPSDAPVIMHGIETELGRPVYGLAEYLFKALPVVGTLWQRVGGVAAHPDNAYRLLHDNQQLVLVFPEGTKGTGKRFSQRYQLARFGRGGFVEIAMRAGVPIIPIAVTGSEEAMPTLWNSRVLAKAMNVPYVPLTANMLLMGPLGAALPLPAKFRLRVLEPVTLDVPPKQERYSRARVMDVSEQIRSSIQDALYDMLRERRSIWFG